MRMTYKVLQPVSEFCQGGGINNSPELLEGNVWLSFRFARIAMQQLSEQTNWVRMCAYVSRERTRNVLASSVTCAFYTQSNKNPSAWYFARPAQAVTCGTIAIIIRVVFLSPYLRIRGFSPSSVRYNQSHRMYINPLTPNDPYSGRTAPLTSKRCILYIYSTNIGTEYFKHGIYSPFFYSKCSLFHNSNVFGSCIIYILYTGCAKIKKNNSGAKSLRSVVPFVLLEHKVITL